MLSYFMEVLSLHRLLPFEGTWRSVTKQVGNSRLKMIATFFYRHRRISSRIPSLI